MCRFRILALALAAGTLQGFWLAPLRAEVLITEQEARRPAAERKATEAARGIFRAPKIHLLSPAEGEATSPINLKLKFESFGGTKIDQDSIKIIYLKSPLVDLTPRLMRHLKNNAIDLGVAEVPPGEHRLKVEVKDSDGRLGTADFILKVAK